MRVRWLGVLASSVAACNGSVSPEPPADAWVQVDGRTYAAACIGPDRKCVKACLWELLHTDFRRACDEALYNALCEPLFPNDPDPKCTTGKNKCWVRLDDPTSGAYFFCSSATFNGARWRECTEEEGRRMGEIDLQCVPYKRTLETPFD